ncbi:MAG: DNA repair protein RecN, partial [Casimicrobiaceae bacterium]
VAATASAFDAWRAAATALDRSQLDDREKRARIEMASFQLQDIDHVAPLPGEDDQLAADRQILANAERLTRLSTEAYAALYEGDSAVLAMLAGVWKRVTELAALDPRFAPYLDVRDGQKSGLEDLAFFLRSYVSDLDASPARLQAVEDRLAALERLKRTYGPTLDDVRARHTSLREELAALDAGEERMAALDREERSARQAFVTRASQLAVARRTAARALASALEGELAELAMPNSRVEIRISTVDRPEEWTRNGTDIVEFFLSANPGEEPRALARIASGGELSRIMLALRTSVNVADPGRTLIFDEVDAGIGGAAADAVGARLQSLGRRQQVVCITHLPQIAARSGAHFHISKQVKGGRTTTRAARLDDGGREMEIARMIAGAEVSPQVLSSARELIALRSESEPKAKGERPELSRAKGRSRGA